MTAPNPKENSVKNIAMNIVNQMFDLCEVTVLFRQSNNDKCDKFITDLINNSGLIFRDQAVELMDGCYEIVEIFDATTPSQIEWKKNWLEKARKLGCGGD